MTVARPHRGTISRGARRGPRARALRRRPVRPDAARAEVRARPPTPGCFVHLSCDDAGADAPAAVDHARASRPRLDRGAVQDRRPGPATRSRRAAPASRSTRSARSATASSRIASARARCWSAAASAFRRWCFSPNALREDAAGALEAAGADGLGDSVSVSRAALDDPACRACPKASSPACRCSTNGASRAGSRASRAIAGCHEGYVTELAAAWLALAGSRSAGRGGNVRVRPDADAQGRRCRRAPLRRRRARSRSKNSWRAPSAAVRAARCGCRRRRARR